MRLQILKTRGGHRLKRLDYSTGCVMPVALTVLYLTVSYHCPMDLQLKEPKNVGLQIGCMVFFYNVNRQNTVKNRGNES